MIIHHTTIAVVTRVVIIVVVGCELELQQTSSTALQGSVTLWKRLGILQILPDNKVGVGQFETVAVGPKQLEVLVVGQEQEGVGAIVLSAVVVVISVLMELVVGDGSG